MRRDPDGGPRPGRQALRAGSLAVVAAVAAILAPPLRGQEPALEVREVRFEGNETFPSDSLSRAIVTRETECRAWVLQPFCWFGLGFAERRVVLRERELPRDRARLTIWYQRRGFIDVLVDSAQVMRVPGHVDVLFRISEGRPILASSVDFEGPDSILTEPMLADLPLREGDRLSRLTQDATRDTLIRRLHDRGFARADVFNQALRPADDPYNARVTFEVVPGRLATYGPIDIQGITELSPGTVRRTLQFQSGDLYRASDVEAARARLFGLDIVRSAQVQPDLTAEPDSVVPVSVLVQEGDAYRVRTGGGWSSAECLAYEARWTSRNFLGGGRFLQVRGRLGNILASELGGALCRDAGSGRYARLTGVAAVDFAQPWIFSSNNSFTASIFAERQTLPDIFVRNAVGFQLGLTRTIDAGTTLTGFYRPELSELDADRVLFCTGFLVCAPEDVNALEGANWLAPVGLVFNRDRADDLLNPRSGFRTTLELEHAAEWTGSTYRYDRAVAEVSHYRALVGPAVLATRLRGGWVGSSAFDTGTDAGSVSIVHPQRRFFAGGANSVRGYGQSRLGPRILFVRSPEELLSPTGEACAPEELVDLSCDVGVRRDLIGLQERPTGGTRVVEGNAEIRIPLLSWLEVVAFTDFGQAWGGDQGVEISNVELTPGFGVRVPSPVGPIRLDLAFRPRRDEALSVIVPQIRPFDPLRDDPEAQIDLGDPMPIPYVRTDQLVTLLSPLIFQDDRGLQLHISIGQAF